MDPWVHNARLDKREVPAVFLFPKMGECGDHCNPPVIKNCDVLACAGEPGAGIRSMDSVLLIWEIVQVTQGSAYRCVRRVLRARPVWPVATIERWWGLDVLMLMVWCAAMGPPP